MAILGLFDTGRAAKREPRFTITFSRQINRVVTTAQNQNLARLLRRVFIQVESMSCSETGTACLFRNRSSLLSGRKWVPESIGIFRRVPIPNRPTEHSMNRFAQVCLASALIVHFTAWPCFANAGWIVYLPASTANIQRAATFNASGIADISNVAIRVKFMDTGSGMLDDFKDGTSGADAFGSWGVTFDPTTGTGTVGGVWRLGGHTVELWTGTTFRAKTSPTVVL